MKQLLLGLDTTSQWSEAQNAFLRDNYPSRGKLWCARELGKTEAQIRKQAARLGLRQDRSSEFFKDWQRRAAASKIGKKRPAQAVVMKQLHAQGKLTKTPEQLALEAEAIRRRFRAPGFLHPRGFLGAHHSEGSKALIAAKSKATWETRTEAEKREFVRRQLETRAKNGSLAPNHVRGSWKAGWRVVGGQRIYARSRWEANYARFLEWLRGRGEIIRWTHEAKTFWFDDVRRGAVSYLPDFEVETTGGALEYHEVKGWMDPRSLTKLRRMRVYHPKVKLVVIASKEYRAISKKLGRVIPAWE